MKMTLSALALGFAVVLAAPAMAESVANVHQNGNDNDAQITQAYNWSATASILQFGNRNDAEISQFGNFHNVVARIRQDNGNDNDAQIRQFRGVNLLATIHQNGGENDASVIQSGFDKTAHVLQVGQGNNARIYQTESFHSMQ